MKDSLVSWFLLLSVFLFLTTATFSQGEPHVTYDGDSVVVEGDPFQISCQLTMFDTVKWQKDGQTLYPDMYNNYTLEEESKGGNVLARLSVSFANIFHSGNYRCYSFDNKSHQIYVLSANPSQGQPIYVPVKYKQKAPITLLCEIRRDSALVLKWWKDEQVINFDDPNDRYELKTDDERHLETLVISSPNEDDLGNYTCQLYNTKNLTVVENMSVNFLVMSDLTIKMEEAINVIEGEELKLKCVVTSKSKPHRIVWQFENTTYETSKDRVKLMADDKNIPNAVFQIEKSVMDDRGSYRCMAYATSIANATVADTYVRVKDKFAALWPFLGICAEVFILCAIILIYEKKRNKAELEESDTDQSPDQKNTTDQGKDSVRQRK